LKINEFTDSPKFSFYKIKPKKIYFSGGFGVMATWVDVGEYESARPDVLASEVSSMIDKINSEKQGELLLLCKHFIQVENPDKVKLSSIDRLGVDLRVKTGEYTDEFRIAFRYPVSSSEDAKSELVKLFQEAWERDNGFWQQYTDMAEEGLPIVSKYAEDILRSANK
jgi:putative heme iron utilization protein